MRLHELVAGFEAVLPAEDPEVHGICHDSRRVEPGDLFVAIVGEHHDGRVFAQEAIARGAAAILGPPRPPIELRVPWVEVADPRALLGPLAARLYDHPDDRLTLVGVTGTNGKSTVVALVGRILEEAGLRTGLIGTLGHSFGGHTSAAEHTTPEASDLFRLLAEMAAAGAGAVAMEVSSHALELGRVAGARFDVGVFMNLTRDHLDFHPTMEAYFETKRRVFDQLKPAGRAVVGSSDAWGRKLACELPEALVFGAEDLDDAEVDDAETLDVAGRAVRASGIELSLDGIRATLATPSGEIAFHSPLLGRLNLDNVLAAAAVAEALDVPLPAMAAGIAARPALRGRMELVAAEPVPVVIDFAHTPAALESALRGLRELTDRRLAVVFGCGGDRDSGKRPLMGQIAGEIAELVVVTSDNPRSEDPLQIMTAIEAGVKASGNQNYRLVPDRREAITRTISVCSDGWLVLIAGKGHEEKQIIDGRSLPFSDHREVARALEARRG